MLEFAIALYVVLTASKVPHEVAPIHEVTLIREEELQVLEHRRHFHVHHLATAVEGYNGTIDATHPLLVGLGVAGGVHAREQHVLCVLISVLMAHHEVGVLLVLRGFLAAAVDGSALVHHGLAHVAIGLQRHLRGVGTSVEQRAVAILVAAQIATKCKDVLGRVLVHRRVGRRANHDEGIRRVANHEHQQAAEHRILQACTHHGDSLLVDGLLVVQHPPQQGKHHHADDHCRPAIAVEGNTQQGDGNHEGDVLSAVVAFLIGLPDSPAHGSHEQYDIDNLTRVERHAQHVHEQQLEPSTHGDDARHDAIEHGGDDDERHQQRQE